MLGSASAGALAGAACPEPSARLVENSGGPAPTETPAEEGDVIIFHACKAVTPKQ